MAATASVPAVPAPAGRSRWTRLIPVAIIVYVISFMDRTNIGFAFDGMSKTCTWTRRRRARPALMLGGLVMITLRRHAASRP